MYKENNTYEILTPDGFKPFKGIQKINKHGKTILNINDNTLDCSPKHKVKIGNEFICAKDIKESTTYDLDKEFEYFDIVEVENHQYITNGIISHNCDFIGSSGTLIAGWALKTLKENVKEPIAEDEFMKMYEQPIKVVEVWDEALNKCIDTPEHKYVLIADVSRGKGLDYSAFSVFDVSQMPYRQVFRYRNNNISPRDYADVIHRIAMHYNNAFVLVEINDIGEQVGDILIFECEYENVLCTEAAGKAGKRIVFSSKKCDKGIRTSPAVKLSGCLLLKLLIEQKKLIIPDDETVKEFTIFVKNKNTYKGQDGKHDDLVMGAVLFAWLSDQKFFKDFMDINTIDELREKTLEQIKDELLPFGYVDPRPIQHEKEFWHTTYNLNSPFNPYYEQAEAITVHNF